MKLLSAGVERRQFSKIHIKIRNVEAETKRISRTATRGRSRPLVEGSSNAPAKDRPQRDFEVPNYYNKLIYLLRQ